MDIPKADQSVTPIDIDMMRRFSSQDEMDTHFIALKVCDLSSEEAVESITTNIEKYLRSRKKTYLYQTEEHEWKENHQSRFPGENVPKSS